MSLVGNISFGNYDRTAQSSGAHLYRTPSYRTEQDPTAYPLQDAPARRNSLLRRISTVRSEGNRQSSEYPDNAIREEPLDDNGAHERVVELARELSRHTSHHSMGQHPNVSEEFLVPKDSEFDPFSANFNSKAWIKRMVGVVSRDPEQYPMRTAGVAYKNLKVFGYGGGSDYQETVGNKPLAMLSSVASLASRKKNKVHILKGFDGLLEAGELLVVLGPPGSGCSTLLKTIAGETHGIYIEQGSEINYQGIEAKQMHSNFRGEALYTAEQDIHFPNLTVNETLSFASEARAHKTPPPGVTRKQFSQHLRDVVMTILGISHTGNTKVGNEFVRGVSGGERKRVTIAEAMLSGAPLSCWDNSTRGLDAANAIEFCKTLRTMTDYGGSTAAVAIYQAPQSAYEYFDKAVVLYDGYQIYYGPAKAAKAYFEEMGFECPDQQSTPDFLTSMTSAIERVPKKGWEQRVPRTAAEFNKRWLESETYAQLIREIDDYNNNRFPFGGEALEKFKASRRAQQAKRTSAKSPYTLSYGQQIKLCLKRGWWRFKSDPSLTLSQLFGNFAMSLIIASVFYNLPNNTSSFYNRGGALFFAVLLNAFGSALEILTLYGKFSQRPIVEKHERYAFYKPSAEAFASMACDLPYKIINAITFNLPFYFLVNLRREPGNFFFFVFLSFLATLAMSMFFRSVAALSRSLVQALTPAAVLILGLVLYTGFALPVPYMKGWISWFRFLNPIFFVFESLMVNEFNGRDFPCVSFVPTGPGYTDVAADQTVCSSVGSVPGQSYVNGNTYIETAYGYQASHKWRNVGIVIAFIVGLGAIYLTATDVIKGQKSKGEVIVFPRRKQPKRLGNDEEQAAAGAGARGDGASSDDTTAIQKQTAIFHWQDVCYDVQIKDETRRILDHVDGWVKPGTLTALMGVSGAGKTTLLDVLATRVSTGVVSGEMLVDGKMRDESFQRSTGYAMQQDVHLATSTVREALEFSALLRQPRNIPREEKIAYVDEVLKLLDMEEYQHAVVGELGEGLNVEQRKRLTIGVELAARPALLLFLDEPTSGLDSQTSFSILKLLEKLAGAGVSVLCTIHQPSALLFERFDRLLFLQKGGKTVYFNEVGKNSKTLIDYFERNGGPKYPDGANPAEWMLEVIGAAPGSHTDVDWHKTWLESPERQSVRDELASMKQELPGKNTGEKDPSAFQEFAAPLWKQYTAVQMRVFQQLWRTPSYIYSKLLLVTAVGLFIGFSLFKADTSQQGLQNQLYGIFLLFTVFGQLTQQIMPQFVTQRALYEVRERPAKTYSWKIFMLSNIIAELPWNTLASILLFFCWYYPIGFYRNAEPTDEVNIRGFLVFLLVWAFLMFTSTFSHMIVAAMPTAETAGNIGNLMFSLTLVFCGVLVTRSDLGWWIWLYWLSPFHYLAEGLLTGGVANAEVRCSQQELLNFNPSGGQTCEAYMQPFISAAGGYLTNPEATADCNYCALDNTNTFLANFDMHYSNAWRDFGVLMIYVVFNVFAAMGLYYLARMPKKSKKQKAESPKPEADASKPKLTHSRS